MGDHETSPETNRRSFMQWASIVGLTAVAPGTISAVADAKEERERPDPIPESKRGNRKEDVQLSHPLEQSGIKARQEAFADENDPEIFYKRALRDQLSENANQSSVNVFVQTVGQENTITTNRYDRTVSGWQPTDAEVRQLQPFGDVGFVGEFLSPVVTLKNVDRSDLSALANLDRVLSVNIDPDGGNDADDIDVDSLRSTDYYWFENVEDQYNTLNTNGYIRVGVVDSGYQGNGYSNYTESYAGGNIDTSLAKDFTDDNTGWDDPKDNHGDNVADTIYYMLQEANPEMFVPLKIHDEDSDPEWSDNIRAAIEYAAKNDIEVINISQGTQNNYDYCNAQFCQELWGYARMGYIAVSTSGNDGKNGEVGQPGGSRWNIGVGGIDNGGCSSADHQRDSKSNYGDIYYDYCEACQTQKDETHTFCPDIYGCYETETDAGATISGTSFAAPQAAAAAIIMQDNGLYDYEQAQTVFTNMQSDPICPTAAAQSGQLLDALWAYYRTD